MTDGYLTREQVEVVYWRANRPRMYWTRFLVSFLTPDWPETVMRVCATALHWMDEAEWLRNDNDDLKGRKERIFYRQKILERENRELRNENNVLADGLETLRKCPCGHEWAICSRHKEGPQSLVTRLTELNRELREDLENAIRYCDYDPFYGAGRKIRAEMERDDG